MTNTPDPSVPPPAIEAVIAEMHQRIVNLPCAPKGYGQKVAAWLEAYRFGHRDARHAAAELVASLRPHPSPQPDAFDFVAHLARQAAFSQRTFGPGARSAAVVDHIRKELLEVEAEPTNLSEWMDVVILGLDGAWRAGHSPEAIVSALVAKQTRNEARMWPDWRTADPNKAIEHVRTSLEPPPDAPPQGIAALIAGWRKESARLVEEANTAIWPSDVGRMSLRQKARTLTECADAADALAASPRPSPAQDGAAALIAEKEVSASESYPAIRDELLAIHKWIKTPGNINNDDAIDEIGRLLMNRIVSLATDTIRPRPLPAGTREEKGTP